MAHFAELDKNNIVLRVIAVSNEDTCKDSIKDKYYDILPIINSISGKEIDTSKVDISWNAIDTNKILEWEDESKGAQFCIDLLGGNWVQTSYNNNFRKRYAGIGYTYDEKLDIFIVPKFFESWSLDRSGDWQAPVDYPSITFLGEDIVKIENVPNIIPYSINLDNERPVYDNYINNNLTNKGIISVTCSISGVLVNANEKEKIGPGEFTFNMRVLTFYSSQADEIATITYQMNTLITWDEPNLRWLCNTGVNDYRWDSSKLEWIIL